MIRIHILVNAFWQMSGGDKRVVETIARWVRDAEVNIRINLYCPADFTEYIDESILSDIKVFITDRNHCGDNSLLMTYIRRTRVATRLLRNNLSPGDIVYASSDFFTDVIPCYKVAKTSDIKWISLIHHVIEDYTTRPGSKIKNYIAYKLQQRSINKIGYRADSCFVVSPLVYQKLINDGFEEGKLRIINNGIDVSLIDSIEASNETDSYDAIMVARLMPSKGIFELPNVWKKVTDRLPSAKLAIIGKYDEDILKQFNDECVKCGVHIDVLGYRSTEDIIRIQKNSKCYVFTSREEGWGIAIAEAMAAGLPVIAFELPIYKYIFGDNIISIPNRDAGQMADRIVEILNDDTMRQQIGMQSSKFVKDRYDWSKVAADEMQLIRQVIGEE